MYTVDNWYNFGGSDLIVQDDLTDYYDITPTDIGSEM